MYDWLFSLVRDPSGRRFGEPKTAAEQRAHFEAQIQRTADFLAFAGHPERGIPAVHVAGTSGKGSVTVMTAALLQSLGGTVCHHTSPYLQSYLEKLNTNGRWLAQEQFDVLVGRLQAVHGRWEAATGQRLRYTEAWVGLTMLWLAEEKPAWAVIETSLGGRFDPTNILPAELAIITNVDWDHEQVLGPTLADIAWHKAGIIKPNQPVLTAATQPEVLAVIRQEAAEKNAPLYALGDQWHYHITPAEMLTVEAPFNRYVNINVAGMGYQAHNAAVALAAVDVLGHSHSLRISAAQAERVLTAVRFAGRLETVQENPLVILDGAHNPHKMATLVASLQAKYPQQKATAVVGSIAGKNAEAMLSALAPLVGRWVFTQPHVPGKPAIPPAELAGLVGETAVPVQTADIVQEALAVAFADPSDYILITGSLYLVGEARGYWYPLV
ncbi:MAG: Mur ligase family protein [Chloroflexi bacterium]|nr:Mur ligase family protein [Chloroflexota bacterium]